jgi:integrase
LLQKFALSDEKSAQHAIRDKILDRLLGLRWQDVDVDRTMSLKVRRILVRQATPDKSDNDYEVLTEGEKTALMLGRVKTTKGYRSIYLPDVAVEMFRKIKSHHQSLTATFGGGFNPRGFVFCNRPVLKSSRERKSEDFFRRARKRFSAIICLLPTVL